MKRKDQLKQLAGMGAERLAREVRAARERLWNLRSELVAGKVKNVREIRSLRRSLSRLLTAMRAGTGSAEQGTKK